MPIAQTPRSRWPRRSTRTLADSEAFFEHLRTLPASLDKAKRLQIQAYRLAQTGDRDAIVPSLALLDRIFTEFPEPTQLALAHLQAATCYERLGELEKAIVQFRAALEAQSRRPEVDPGTSNAFPWFIVEHGLTALYDEALDVLARAIIEWPIQMFAAETIRAFIAEHFGDGEAARRHARNAIAEAERDGLRLRDPRDLALVAPCMKPEVLRLMRLAEI